jgi:hypothetical protein
MRARKLHKLEMYVNGACQTNCALISPSPELQNWHTNLLSTASQVVPNLVLRIDDDN